MGKYRELKNEPAASVDRVRELEAELKAMRLLLQEKEHTLADTQEELAIVKSSAHLQQTKALRFQFVENHRSQFLWRRCAPCYTYHGADITSGGWIVQASSSTGEPRS